MNGLSNTPAIVLLQAFCKVDQACLTMRCSARGSSLCCHCFAWLSQACMQSKLKSARLQQTRQISCKQLNDVMRWKQHHFDRKTCSREKKDAISALGTQLSPHNVQPTSRMYEDHKESACARTHADAFVIGDNAQTHLRCCRPCKIS